MRWTDERSNWYQSILNGNLMISKCENLGYSNIGRLKNSIIFSTVIRFTITLSYNIKSLFFNLQWDLNLGHISYHYLPFLKWFDCFPREWIESYSSRIYSSSIGVINERSSLPQSGSCTFIMDLLSTFLTFNNHHCKLLRSEIPEWIPFISSLSLPPYLYDRMNCECCSTVSWTIVFSGISLMIVVIPEGNGLR